AQLMLITQRAQYRRQKIPYIIVRVKTDEARSQQTIKDLLTPLAWQHLEDLERGKRDVQEKSDGHFRKFFTHELGQQHQVIIMYPQDIIRFQHLDHRLGEEPVHLAVFLPV